MKRFCLNVLVLVGVFFVLYICLPVTSVVVIPAEAMQTPAVKVERSMTPITPMEFERSHDWKYHQIPQNRHPQSGSEVFRHYRYRVA